MSETFMKREQAATYLRVSKRTLEKWVERGTGPAYRRSGRRTYYNEADLDGWIKEHPLPPSPADGVWVYHPANPQ
ncbi:MAG: hypothetical protein COA85_03245 [Robiginitomaculum sp.]|nr:MAG: hypothetical protein COA85_03245 [Robiginitomaculum sp.]